MVRAVLLLLFVFSVSLEAQTQLPWSVLGSGGSVGTPSAGRVLSGTLGQPIIGVGSITDGSEIYQGFWLPLDVSTSVAEDGASPSSNDVTNYPNPFSTSTTIHIGGSYEGQARIKIYDVNGNLVRELSQDLFLSGGRDILFDGLDAQGRPLASGIYPYEVIISPMTGREVRMVDRMTILQ